MSNKTLYFMVLCFHNERESDASGSARTQCQGNVNLRNKTTYYRALGSNSFVIHRVYIYVYMLV